MLDRERRSNAGNRMQLLIKEFLSSSAVPTAASATSTKIPDEVAVAAADDWNDADAVVQEEDDVIDSDFESTEEDDNADLDDEEYHDLANYTSLRLAGSAAGRAPLSRTATNDDDDEDSRPRRKRRIQPHLLLNRPRHSLPGGGSDTPGGSVDGYPISPSLAGTPGTPGAASSPFAPFTPANATRTRVRKPRRDVWATPDGAEAAVGRRTSDRPATVRSKQRLEARMRARRNDSQHQTPAPNRPQPQQLTQTELIAEALEVTEPMNLKYLEDVSRLEDEWHANARKAAEAAKERRRGTGRAITYLSITVDGLGRRVSQLDESSSGSSSDDDDDDEEDDDEFIMGETGRAAAENGGEFLRPAKRRELERQRKKERYTRNYLIFSGYEKDPWRWMKRVGECSFEANFFARCLSLICNLFLRRHQTLPLRRKEWRQRAIASQFPVFPTLTSTDCPLWTACRWRRVLYLRCWTRLEWRGGQGLEWLRRRRPSTGSLLLQPTRRLRSLNRTLAQHQRTMRARHPYCRRR
ncbi:YL1 nuclear protein-domain-containing protein [Zopfochytrium polystomum]|nr:YL1 nuclear protein-domain-containing protein [Zopfochytrium polystomum]